MFFTTKPRHFNLVKVLTSIWFKLVLIMLHILHADLQHLKDLAVRYYLYCQRKHTDPMILQYIKS